MTGLAAAARVVLVAPNWLGDAVLALPAMAAVRAAIPGAHLAVAAPPSVAPIFREATGVRPDHVCELTGGSSGVAARLREGGYDLALLFPNSFGSAWRVRQAGIPARWGFRTSGRRWLLTRSAPRPPRRDAPHMVDYYRALVRAFGVSADASQAPALAATPGSLQAADRLLSPARGGRLVAIAPGAAYGQAKQWPPVRVAELIVRLHDLGARTVLVGAAHDRPAARAIESSLRREAPAVWPDVIDVVGKTSLSALAGIASRADVFVSNDSGAMHLAAAAGRPVVAIFGPTDERATGPVGRHDVLTAPAFCRPCGLRDCPIDHRCMTRISVERVVAAVAAHIGAP